MNPLRWFRGWYWHFREARHRRILPDQDRSITELFAEDPPPEA